MSPKKLLMLGLAAGLLALGGWKAFSHFMAPSGAAASLRARVWACPMRCLGKTYERPGQCPVCHMQLVELSAASPGVRLGRSLWPELGGRTAIYFRPSAVAMVQADRLLRAAGSLKGSLLTARLLPGEAKDLKPGASAMVMPAEGYARPVLGKVLSASGGRLRVRLSRPLPGLSHALAEIRVSAPPSLGVPLEAVQEDSGKALAWVKEGEGYAPREVRITRRGERFIAVEGLKAGEIVAGAGLFWLEAQWRMDHPASAPAPR